MASAQADRLNVRSKGALSLLATEVSRIPTLSMLDGTNVSAVDDKAHYTVLIFTRTDCPIANKLVPHINQLTQDFSSQGAAIRMVYPIPTESNADVVNHQKEYSIVAPAFRDDEMRATIAMGATITPQAFVLTPAGQVVYQGRINDLFSGFGVSRQTAQRNDLRIALEELLAGKPVSEPRTKAIGCYLVPHVNME